MTGWPARAIGCLVAVAVLAAALPPASPARAASSIRWGYYVTYSPTSIATLRAQIDQFTHISPYYFNLKEDATLHSMEQPATTALIRGRDVKILPMVTNNARYEAFKTMLEEPARFALAVEQVASIALRPEYDGVHVDFEALRGEDRALLTEFMARLAARVRPVGKLVTQAIPAKTSDTRNGWGGAFDYGELGKHNDLVVIMAYDFSYVDGEPGPIAPVDWVRRVGAYAGVSFGLNATVLGAPLYGYDWIVNQTPRPRAKSVSHEGALDLVARHGGQRGYDEGRHSEWARYRVGEEEHEIWFESARSLRAKLEVMQMQGLAGVALWRLGQEHGEIWAAMRELATPASPVPLVPSTRDRLYFRETRHTLSGAFLRYWQTNGGLPRFGYPLTEEFAELNPQDGRTYTVQYFERARFELHPENAGTPYEVLLGHLGRWAMTANGVEAWPPLLAGDGDDLFFPETGQTLRAGFRAYWEANGGLFQFGLPLTGEFEEFNPEDGAFHTVQYFERARFEHHPANAGTPHEILLGHLGRQTLRQREWMP